MLDYIITADSVMRCSDPITLHPAVLESVFYHLPVREKTVIRHLSRQRMKSFGVAVFQSLKPSNLRVCGPPEIYFTVSPLQYWKNTVNHLLEQLG